MVNFTTYGMAGIGIAAAIGFVFALSVLGNNNTLSTGPNPAQQQTGPQSLSTLQQKSQLQEEGNESNNPPMQDQGTAAKLQSSINNESAADRQQMMTMANEQPTLTSIVALNGSREIIGEVLPQMEFRANSAVFIQANFANNNQDDIPQHTITMALRGQNGENINAVSFNGSISKSTSIALEFYWLPSRTGDFTIVVFSNSPGNLESTSAAAKPAAEIPVRVVE